MGLNEANIYNQLRKGQGETNDRLDRIGMMLQHLVAAQQQTNLLLAAIGGPKAAAILYAPPAAPETPPSRG